MSNDIDPLISDKPKPINYSNNNNGNSTTLYINDNLLKDNNNEEDDLPISHHSHKKKHWVFDFLKVLIIIISFAFIVGLVVLIVQLVELFHTTTVIDFNIHIKLSQQCENEAMTINTLATQIDKNQQINFNVTQQPHITLYLTRFLNDFQSNIIQNINSTLTKQILLDSTLKNCEISTLTYVNVSGGYALWNTLKPNCLQTLSDAIVNATAEFVDPRIKNTIPDWVYTLPEPIKEKKISMIQFYGSPNVFSQFDPHVTVAHDDITPKELIKSFENIPINTCTFKVQYVTIGLVGPYGTVLRGKDVQTFDLTTF
ncbi:hypothetical protein ABK040_005858 [Willaertia magna]